MKDPKRVLFVNSEIFPYLPETPRAILGRFLPQGIQERGKEIRSFMPRFGCINERKNQLHEVIRLSGMNIIVNDVDRPLVIKVSSIPSARMQVYFIDNEDYFHRKLVFTDAEGNFIADNDERAAFFARGVLETVKKLRWKPDIIHCQGWISALVPLYIKKAYMEEPSFRDSKVVLSLFENELKSNLQEDIIEKILLKNIEKSDIEDVIPASATYKDLYKLAIKYSDGVILHSENIDPELIAYAREMGIPVLEHQPIETFTDAINQFYDDIWS